MDYRERKYYLVRLNDGLSPFWWVKGHDNHGVRYDSYLKYFKDKIKLLKISSPYNHIKTNPNKNKWDGAMQSWVCPCCGWSNLNVETKTNTSTENIDLGRVTTSTEVRNWRGN